MLHRIWRAYESPEPVSPLDSPIIVPKTHKKIKDFCPNTNRPSGRFVFWWGTACTNRAGNKQEFTDLMQRVKEFKEKWF
jgi:hypothetical protein